MSRIGNGFNISDLQLSADKKRTMIARSGKSAFNTKAPEYSAADIAPEDENLGNKSPFIGSGNAADKPFTGRKSGF